jgi:2-deoxy-D-gluconate 3-dehydrogenase
VTVFDLTGRKAFVTGASRGIGRVIAIALAQAGADVAIAARSQDGLAETAREVTALGRKAFVFPLDVTRPDDVTAAVHEAIRLLGHLDIVVNNAGGTNFTVPFSQMRMSGWEKVMRLNVDATLYVCQAAGPHLHERGAGSIINVASVAGLSAAPGLMPYGAAKAAIISVTRTLAVEWAPAGIRVNALCPGWTATELNRNLWDTPDGGQSTIATVPMARWARPEEMAGPAVFLASNASSFMTGQVLIIDGGQLATALSGPGRRSVAVLCRARFRRYLSYRAGPPNASVHIALGQGGRSSHSSTAP